MKKKEMLRRIAKIVSRYDDSRDDDSRDSSLEMDVEKAFGLQVRQPSELNERASPPVHKFNGNSVCETDARGYRTPGNRDALDLVLHAGKGFIPLWAYASTLHWRFNEASMEVFRHPTKAMDAIRKLFREAVMAWGSAAPVRFAESEDSWDFEFFMRPKDNCKNGGCVLASAFFPDSGRHRLNLYPKMFTQNRKEQVDTLTHEVGHIFGLRHFFAKVSETAWPSVIFGEHRPFSIMNYGHQSELTEVDKSDLKRLYHAVWSGQITEINQTPIRLFKPFHAAGETVEPRFAVHELIGGPPGRSANHQATEMY